MVSCSKSNSLQSCKFKDTKKVIKWKQYIMPIIIIVYITFYLNSRDNTIKTSIGHLGKKSHLYTMHYTL